METTTYTVIKTINDIDSEHTGKITEQCKKVLSSFQKGESFEARKFVKERMPRFTNSSNARNIANMDYRGEYYGCEKIECKSLTAYVRIEGKGANIGQGYECKKFEVLDL